MRMLLHIDVKQKELFRCKKEFSDRTCTSDKYSFNDIHMILPKCISSPVAKRLFLPFYGVPSRLEKNSGTSKKSWIFVNFD